MKAMVLKALTRLPRTGSAGVGGNTGSGAGAEDLLVQVSACGVCHTSWMKSRAEPRRRCFPSCGAPGRGAGRRGRRRRGRLYPRRSGGDGVDPFGLRTCDLCRAGVENLCADFRATGRDANGGYAEFAVIPAAFAHRIPEVFTEPLLPGTGGVGPRAPQKRRPVGHQRHPQGGCRTRARC